VEKEKASKMRLINEEDVPIKLKKKGSEWLQAFQKIPRGRAWALTEEEAGVKASSIKIMVARLKKLGLLSPHYKVAQRTIKDKLTVYVINSIKDTEETKEDKAS
jgi:hypothetical protein